MSTPKHGPGPAAASAFRLGMLTAIVGGLAVIGAGYLQGALTAMAALYSLIALFPVYLVVVAAGLSAWLGYDKDTTDLRPVYR